MSSGLSGSYQTAVVLAQEFEDGNKVAVVDAKRISVCLRGIVESALKLASQGIDAFEIKKALESDELKSSIYLTVPTLEYLKKVSIIKLFFFFFFCR